MANFGAKSIAKLNTCEKDIQTIMLLAIVYMDFTIIFGQRSPDEQFALFTKGRTQNEQGVWVIQNQDEVVTYKDGTEKKSKHNYEPVSLAIDVAPWPSLWEDKNRFFELGGVVKTCGEQLFTEGKITKKLKWGYDLWSWDEGHFEL